MRRHVADEENYGVAEVLEVLHLAQKHGVAQVKVGRGRIEAGLNAQRTVGLGGKHQPLAEIFFANNLRHALAEVSKLFVDGHKNNY